MQGLQQFYTSFKLFAESTSLYPCITCATEQAFRALQVQLAVLEHLPDMAETLYQFATIQANPAQLYCTLTLILAGILFLCSWNWTTL